MKTSKLFLLIAFISCALCFVSCGEVDVTESSTEPLADEFSELDSTIDPECIRKGNKQKTAHRGRRGSKGFKARNKNCKRYN